MDGTTRLQTEDSFGAKKPLTATPASLVLLG
jgi:hypothetical protein